MTKKQTKKPSKKSVALSSWLDALTKIAADVAPVPASAEGFFIDPDFKRLSVELPPQSLIDAALQEADGSHREELTRRAERLESDYIRFDAARSKWREEVADPIRAKRGELGELADPVGKLRTFRRNACDDVAFITGLLEHGNGKTYKRHKCAEGLDYKKIAALFSAKALSLIKAGSKENPIYEKKRGVGRYIYGLVSDRTIKEWVKKYPDQYAIHPMCGFHAGLLEDKAALNKCVDMWGSYIRDYATQFYEWRQTNTAAPRSAFRYKPKPPPDALK